MLRELRPYQAQAIEALRDSLRAGRRRPVVQAATGAGKTLLAAAIIEMALNKGKRAMFCVPAIELVEQTVAMFQREGISDLGVIQANHELTDGAQPLQICSVQTLMRRPIPKADLVVVDEVHRMFTFVGEWLAKPDWARIPFVGLSATPWTKGLGRHWDDLIVAATTKELIGQGFLCGYRVFAPSHPDLSGVKVRAGDYAENELSDVMSDSKLVADVVETWLAKAEDRPTLCFCVDRAHAKHVQQRFGSAGVSCAYIDCMTPREERDDIRKKFHDGEYKVVTNVGVLTMGVDWDVRCISLCRPTRSEMLFVQIIGRGLRPNKDGQDCLILDHSDSTLTLGLPDDIHHETLDDGNPKPKAERKAPLPKECPSCGVLKPVRVVECPACGFTPQHGPKGVAVEAGELVELNPRKLNGSASYAEKAAWFGQLKMMALERGYKEGWAANQFKSKFGVWPNDPRVRHAVMHEPSGEVRNWVKSRIIAWAKSQPKRQGRFL